ncbi:MAG TPA: integrase core domain-containing protein [Anaerolineales bacterium]
MNRVARDSEYLTGLWKRSLADLPLPVIPLAQPLQRGLEHLHRAPYHPTTQGKIESNHRSMKNVVKLQNYYSPEKVEREIARFVNYSDNQRYHESPDNLTPMDVYTGRAKEMVTRRAEITRRTLQTRRL